MPRIYSSQSDPLDFCKRCFPKSEAVAFKAYGTLGEGPDGRGNCFGYEEDHHDCDYDCTKCRRPLTSSDN